MRALVSWKIAGVIGFELLTVVAYLLFWPVPADPRAWEAQPAAHRGMLTTNTLTSQAGLGGGSEPPVYTQDLIATIRLRRARQQKAIYPSHPPATLAACGLRGALVVSLRATIKGA